MNTKVLWVLKCASLCREKRKPLLGVQGAGVPVSVCIYKSALWQSTCVCACFETRSTLEEGTAGIGGGSSFLAVTRPVVGVSQEHCPLHRLPAWGPACEAAPKLLIGQLWSSFALQFRATWESRAGGGFAGWHSLLQPHPIHAVPSVTQGSIKQPHHWTCTDTSSVSLWAIS